jgi:K+-dependent Na+/Ca+ exchanger-like protein
MFFLAVVAMAFSFYLLAVICDNFFVPALDVIADTWKLPSDVAGATLMAIGSSAPELCIAFIAVFRGATHSEIGAGTIVGSAIFNILVIIGASAIFKTAKLRWEPVMRDLSFYVVSIMLLLGTFWDGVVTFPEALTFVVVYVLYLAVIARWKFWFPRVDVNPVDVVEEIFEQTTDRSRILAVTHAVLSKVIPDVTESLGSKSQSNRNRNAFIAFAVSVVFIGLLSFVMVEAAVIVAEILHIPAAIIALTVVAAGTSIPDLLSSMAVAKQGRGDMAISNGIGSNIFDILIGLGLPWVVVLAGGQSQVMVSTDNLLASIFLLFATVIVVFTLLVLRKWILGNRAGWLLIAMYVLYLVYTIYTVFS